MLKQMKKWKEEVIHPKMINTKYYNKYDKLI